MTLARFSDSDGRSREVDLEDGPRERGLGRRGDRNPQVLADFHVEGEIGQVGGLEELVRAEGDIDRCHVRFLSPRQVDDPAGAGAGGEMTLFVELPVVGEITLGHHAEHLAAVDDDRTVVQPVSSLQGGPDDYHREEVAGCLTQGLDGVENGVQEDVLEQQVVDGVAGQAEFGEDGDGHVAGVELPAGVENTRHVRCRVTNVHRRGACCDSCEALVICRVEIPLHGASLAESGVGKPGSHQFAATRGICAGSGDRDGSDMGRPLHHLAKDASFDAPQVDAVLGP